MLPLCGGRIIPQRPGRQLNVHSSQVSALLTLGTYSHVVPELATEAAARMDAALWGIETRTETKPPAIQAPTMTFPQVKHGAPPGT